MFRFVWFRRVEDHIIDLCLCTVIWSGIHVSPGLYHIFLVTGQNILRIIKQADLATILYISRFCRLSLFVWQCSRMILPEAMTGVRTLFKNTKGSQVIWEFSTHSQIPHLLIENWHLMKLKMCANNACTDTFSLVKQMPSYSLHAGKSHMTMAKVEMHVGHVINRTLDL